MVKGRLTKSEKYIIEGMLKDKYSVGQIAEELGRTEKTVEKYQAVVRAKSRPSKKKAKKQDPPQMARAKDLMVNETAAKKDSGVSIMTEGASARGDEKQAISPSRMSHGAIYKIDGSDDD